MALTALLLPAGMAWACVAVVSLTTGTKTVQPGDTLEVTGRSFAENVPVDIHLGSNTGPVLATAPAPDSTMNSKFTVAVPLPPDITPGEHFLFATQDHHDMNSGAPARTVFYVGTAPPEPAPPPSRPVGMEAASGPSLAGLLLIGLGMTTAALLVAGGWSLISARRARGASPEAVR